MALPLTEEDIKIFYDVENWSFYDQFSPGPPAQPDLYSNRQIEQHNRREILFAVRGNYEYIFCGSRVRCLPGTVILIGANQPHELLCNGKIENDLLHIWFYTYSRQMIFLRLYQKTKGKREMIIPLCRLPQMQYSLNHYWDRLEQSENEEDRQNIRRCFKSLLSLLLDSAVQQLQASKRSTEQLAMEYAISHINADLANVTVADLAMRSGYSRFHFSKLFKKHFGVSPRQYQQQRCWQYYLEMRRNNESAKNIAEKLGFSNISAFYRWVKNMNDKQKDMDF